MLIPKVSKSFFKSFVLIYLSFVGIRCQKRGHFGTSALAKRDLNLLALKDPYSNFLELVKPIAIKRVSGTPENERVRAYIADQMKSFGWHVEFDEFRDKTPFGVKSFSNVIASLPIGVNFRQMQRQQDQQFPKHFFSTQNRIIFACHYDSKFFAKFDFIGAIDSAVPCAMLLDLAKYLKDNFSKHDFSTLGRHLQFVFFDGEEAFVDWTSTDSIYGSRNYARVLKDKIGNQAFDSIDLFVLLDLIGGDQSNFLNFFPDSTDRSYRLLSRAEKVLSSAKLISKRSPFYFTDLQGMGRFNGIEDDHKPFLKEDVPILHLIPAPFPKVWHTKDDDLDNLVVDHVQDLRSILKLFLVDILNVSRI